MNHNRGILHLDALFSIIPIVLMIVYLLNYVSFMNGKSEKLIVEQIRINKLISIGDYLVKRGLAEKEGENVYPNLINSLEFDYEELRKSFGLNYLYAGFEAQEERECIYRIVITEQKEIKKLFICGE